MTDLMWTIKKIVHLMKSFKKTTMIYIHHETNSIIVNQTKLSIINIDKLNIKLIKSSIYLSQFRLKIRHKFEKFNIISNALSKFSIKEKNTLNNLNLDFGIENFLNNSKNAHYIEIDLLLQISNEFKKKLLFDYQSEKTWKDIMTMFKNLEKKIFKKIIENDIDEIKIIFTSIDFELRENLIFYIKRNNKLCILSSCEKNILKEIHDKNMHAKHQRIYEKLIKTMFMFKMFKKMK